MSLSPHHRNVTALLTLLLCSSIAFLWGFEEFHIEFFVHLSAVCIEVFLSILIVDIYLERERNRETLRIYSVARHYIYDRILMKFKPVFNKTTRKTNFIDKMGVRSSGSIFIDDENFFKEVGEEILNELTDDDIFELIKTVKVNFEKLESSANLNMVYHNQDLFISLTNFTDICYMVEQLDKKEISKSDIIKATRNDDIVDVYIETLRSIFIRLIATWLYITNNFIYHSSLPSHVLRTRFRRKNGQRDSNNLQRFLA